MSQTKLVENHQEKAIKKVFTKKCWKYFFVSSFLTSLQVAAYVGVIVLLQYVNAAMMPDSTKWLFPQYDQKMQLAILVPIMLVICASSFVLGIIGNKFSVGFAKQVSMNTRNLIYSKIQTFSMVDIDKFSQSSLINRLTIDITNIATATEFSARVLVKSLFLYFGGLIGLIVVVAQANANPQITTQQSTPSYWIVLSIVILSITLIVVIVFISGFAFKPFKATQKNLDRVNGLTQETILGQRTIKSFNLQDLQFQKFDIANEDLRRSTSKSGYIMAAILPTVYLFLDMALVLATWLSNKQLIDVLMQIYLLVSLMIVALVLTIVGVVQISRAIPSFKRAFEVINYKPSIIFKDKEAKLGNENCLEFKNVSFKFPNANENSLSDINLKINPNEVIGIIGPTGSGKSTLMNLITRMYDPTHGSIKLADADLKNLTKHQLKSIVSYCPQQVVLFSGTIKSNLEFGKPNAIEQEMDQVTKIANLYDFVATKPEKYNYPITQRATNLSGGQKQRLSIARSLIKKSPFLLLDDATSALDMITEKNICQELVKNPYKQTILISSQRINAIRNADKIVVLNEGKIIAIGKHHELLKKCQYYYDVAVIQMGQKEVNNEITKK